MVGTISDDDVLAGIDATNTDDAKHRADLQKQAEDKAGRIQIAQFKDGLLGEILRTLDVRTDGPKHTVSKMRLIEIAYADFKLKAKLSDPRYIKNREAWNHLSPQEQQQAQGIESVLGKYSQGNGPVLTVDVIRDIRALEARNEMGSSSTLLNGAIIAAHEAGGQFKNYQSAEVPWWDLIHANPAYVKSTTHPDQGLQTTNQDSPPAGAQQQPQNGAAASGAASTRTTATDQQSVIAVATPEAVLKAADSGEALFNSGANKLELTAEAKLVEAFKKQLSDPQYRGKIGQLKIDIVASSDNTGNSHDKNQALSQERADYEKSMILKAATAAGITGKDFEALSHNIHETAQGQQGAANVKDQSKRHATMSMSVAP